jgi:5-methylcytosine-specific restriction endonuclease McrA
MMPAAFAPQPADRKLRACLARYRKSKRADVWKAFRADSNCGPRAVDHLRAAYGGRCLYCDNAYGWTIDHVASKAAKPKARFQWANWRPSCMDCNNRKSSRRIVDPVRQDPRRYIVFDLTTGEPIVIAKKSAKPIAEATRNVIGNQTLNEARRVVRSQMVGILKDVIARKTGAKARALAMLDRAIPHRAILRDLILEPDPVLNPYRVSVDAALLIMPELEAWARTP